MGIFFVYVIHFVVDGLDFVVFTGALYAVDFINAVRQIVQFLAGYDHIVVKPCFYKGGKFLRCYKTVSFVDEDNAILEQRKLFFPEISVDHAARDRGVHSDTAIRTVLDIVLDHMNEGGFTGTTVAFDDGDVPLDR